MSCNNCNCSGTSIESSFAPGTWNIKGLKVGSVIKRSWIVKQKDGSAIPITEDTFTTVVKNSDNQVVIGAIDNSVTGDMTLNFLFKEELSAAAGTYTYVTYWAKYGTDEIRPLFAGSIEVLP